MQLRLPGRETASMTEDEAQEAHRGLIRELTEDDVKVRSRDESRVIDAAAVERLTRLTDMFAFTGALFQGGALVANHALPALNDEELASQQLSPQEARAAQIIIGAQYMCLGAKAMQLSQTTVTIPVRERLELDNTAVEIASEVLRSGDLRVRAAYAACAFSESDLRISWNPADQR